MLTLVIELIACLTLFAQLVVAHDEQACKSHLSDLTEVSGQSMLQVKRQEAPPPQVWNKSRMVAILDRRAERSNTLSHKSRSALDTARDMQSAHARSKLRSLGSLATLNEKGYRKVADSCCQLEMELFIRRFIDGLGLEICDEDGLLSLLMMHSSCDEQEEGSFLNLKSEVEKATEPANCAFVAPSGSCPKDGPRHECFRGMKTSYHRRRQCNTNVQRKVSAGDFGECELPKGAVWCEVRLTNIPAFWMAVYDWDVAEDWVSHNICEAGYWEIKNVGVYGAPGHMLDIGGNIGYYTLAFAQAGWKVTTFEPMTKNLELIRASLCRNPKLSSRVHVNWFGLGTEDKECRMMVPKDNVGDGFSKCKNDGREDSDKANNFIDSGPLNIRRLDEVLLEQGINRVDLVKIDVEGYEAEVFKGSRDFLHKYKPRLIKSEVWANMVGGMTGLEYLDKFKHAGYKIYKDARCKTTLNPQEELDKGSIDVVMCLQ